MQTNKSSKKTTVTLGRFFGEPIAIMAALSLAVCWQAEGASNEKKAQPSYSVVGGDGVFVVGKGKKIQLTDWAAQGEIMSSWSPTGRYVVIFVPHPRVTEVLVFDCESGTEIRTSQQMTRFPDWFEREAVTELSSPVKWTSDSTLVYKSAVGVRGGGKRAMTVSLTVKPPVYSRQAE